MRRYTGLSILVTLMIGICGTALLPAANAQISVDQVIFHFKKGERPFKNLVVRNTSNEQVFINVVAETVIRPGFPDERREATSALVVSPKRFPVAAQGQRTVRLVLEGEPGEVEQVYRVKFLPQGDEFGDGPSSKTKEGKQAVLKVMFSVGILVLADPAEPQGKITSRREADKLVLRNEGNTNVFLDEGKVCERGTQNCTDLPSNRLYGGNEWTLTVPANRSVIFRQQIGDNFDNLVIE